MATRLGFATVVAAIAFAAGAPAQAKLVDVVEFYNATLDHHFISSLADDIAALDSGKFVGWSRTGLGFKAYDDPAAGTSPVCRFYIPPAAGDSHFYSASPAECAEVRTKFPSFDYESPAVMYVGQTVVVDNKAIVRKAAIDVRPATTPPSTQLTCLCRTT